MTMYFIFWSVNWLQIPTGLSFIYFMLYTIQEKAFFQKSLSLSSLSYLAPLSIKLKIATNSYIM